jgi:hypothetical protein
MDAKIRLGFETNRDFRKLYDDDGGDATNFFCLEKAAKLFWAAVGSITNKPVLFYCHSVSPTLVSSQQLVFIRLILIITVIAGVHGDTVAESIPDVQVCSELQPYPQLAQTVPGCFRMATQWWAKTVIRGDV